jgi:hypothetical protein
VAARPWQLTLPGRRQGVATTRHLPPLPPRRPAARNDAVSEPPQTLLKEKLELERIKTKDGRSRWTIKPIEDQLTFDKARRQRRGAPRDPHREAAPQQQRRDRRRRLQRGERPAGSPAGCRAASRRTRPPRPPHDPLAAHHPQGFYVFIRALQLLKSHNDGVVVVGLAGASGSGKTAFSEKVGLVWAGLAAAAGWLG